MEQSVQPQIDTHPKKNFGKWILILVVLCLVSASIYYIVTQRPNILTRLPISNTQTNTQSEISKNIDWKKPVSTEQGYPVVLEEQGTNPKFKIYDIKTGSLTDTGKKVTGFGGASGFGESTPVVSPDLLYTAYIENGKLGILSNETLQSQLTNLGVSWITAWSPDSKKLVVYAGDLTTLKSHTFGGPGAPELGIEKFPFEETFGFYMLNIDTGKLTHLYPVEYVEGFIDRSTLLARLSGTDEYYRNKLVTFNVDTFEADYKKIKDEFGFGTGQFTFSADGLKWSFLDSSNPTNDSKIVYATFPNKSGENVEVGGWADAQFLLMSKDGSKLLYSKREGEIEPGQPNYILYMYDATKKERKSLGVEGMPKAWIDENKVIYRATNASKNINYLFIYDLQTGQSTKIY